MTERTGFLVTPSIAAGVGTILVVAAVVTTGLVVRYTGGDSPEDAAIAACEEGFAGGIIVDDVLTVEDLAMRTTESGNFVIELTGPGRDVLVVVGTTDGDGPQQNVECYVTVDDDGAATLEGFAPAN
jgi:hypothetical protein